jgi:hypothetical protein
MGRQGRAWHPAVGHIHSWHLLAGNGPVASPVC